MVKFMSCNLNIQIHTLKKTKKSASSSNMSIPTSRKGKKQVQNPFLFLRQNSHGVAQAGLELLCSDAHPDSASQTVRTAECYHLPSQPTCFLTKPNQIKNTLLFFKSYSIKAGTSK
jgi:hypothetical protein